MDVKTTILNEKKMKDLYAERRDSIKLSWVNVLEQAAKDLGIDYLSFEELEDTKIFPSDKISMESLLVILDNLVDTLIALGGKADLDENQLNHLMLAYWLPFANALISLADKERTIRQIKQTVDYLEYAFSFLEEKR